MYDVNVEVTYSADLLPALVSEGEVQAYRYIRKQPGGGGCDCNYTAIKDTLSVDKWITNEIHEEGEFPVQQDLMTLVTLDSTTKYQIDNTKENTFVIGNANDSELQNIGYWSFTGSGINLFINLPETESDTGDYAPIMFTEETDTYYKYSEEDGGIYLYIYKTDYENYKKGDIVFVMSLEFSSSIDDTYLGYITFGDITPLSGALEIPCAKFYKYDFPKDLKGTSITIDGLFSKKDNEDVRKTFTINYVASGDGDSGPVGLNMYYDVTVEDTGNEFSALAYVFNENVAQFAPNGFIFVLPMNMDDTDNVKHYGLTKIFSLTTAGMAPVTYTYTDENIKINSAIKVYLNDSENIKIIDRQDGYIEFKRSKVADISFNMEILDVDEEGLVTLFNLYKEPIPTKLSQFQNDTEYITKDNINVTSPIRKGSTLDGEIDLWLQSSYNTSFAQYSSKVITGTLDVNKWVAKSDYYTYIINDYSIFNYSTDVLMTVNSPVILEASDLTDSKLEIKAKNKPTESISYSYKLLATKERGQFTIVNTYLPESNLTIQGQNSQGTEIQKTFNGRLPVELAFNENDFTLTEINGALEVTAVEKTVTVPTKVSQLQNNSGYITQSAIGNGSLNIKKNGTVVGAFTANQTENLDIDIIIPVKTSELTNDSGFISQASIGNGTLKIQKNGTDIGTFTANQNTDIIANITVPTKTSDLQNDSNFITTANIPTKTSELTNDSGFIKASEANIFTLVQTFSNPNGIKTNRVHNLNNNAWYDFDGTNDRIGSLATPTIIRTSETRPKAEVPSGDSTVIKEIALLEDIAGKWVTVTGETATLTQAGTYQLVISNDAQSIVYWDGSTVAEGIKSTIAEVDTNYMTINTTYPHIDANGTLSISYIVVSNATGSWVETTTTMSGFKYRKIN